MDAPWENDPEVATSAAPNIATNTAAPWEKDPEVVVPKAPDMSGAQNTALDNLAKPQGDTGQVQTPDQRWQTATGIPVKSLLAGTAKPEDISEPARAAYVNSLSNGSATTFIDHTQSALLSIAPIVAGMVQRAEHPLDAASSVFNTLEEGTEGAIKSAANLETGVAAPFMAQSSLDKLQASGLYTPRESPVHEYAGALWGTLMSPLAPAFNAATQEAGVLATKAGVSQKVQGEVGQFASTVMDVFGAAGLPEIHGAPSAGPWDNVPGRDAIVNGVAKATGKPAESVASTDIDQAIAKGAQGLAPAAADFKSVETVTNGALPEAALKTVYKETGVPPDKVLADAQIDPRIAQDVDMGKVPDAYEHLLETKEREPDNLQVARSETGKAFNIVDGEGDYVHGGFDSVEEAKHAIEDMKYAAEERAAIESEEAHKPEITTEKTPAGEQTVLPGAEKISDRELAERIMQERAKAIQFQKPANEGLFDVAGRKQQDLFSGNKTIPPSEIGKPTSLRSFLSNNGAKFNEDNELVSIKRGTEKLQGEGAEEHALKIAKEHGYLPKDNPDVPSEGLNVLRNTITENKGGREAFRDKDAGRILASQESKTARQNNDPAAIEHAAHDAGLDTERVKDETDKQYISRLKKALTEFYADKEGSIASDAYRKAVGGTIIAAEKFVGKLTGDFFDQVGEAYVKTFQPELAGDKALRADAYLAKYKATLQEAENSFYRQSAAEIKRFDKMSDDARRAWRYEHETGRWNEEEDPDHARQQAIYDALHKAEGDNGVGTEAYKENYLPHQWEKPDAVKAFFASDKMIKKYGNGWFNKASEFRLTQEAERAGFKLITDNPERMMVSRGLASKNLIATMDLLKDLEKDGAAKPARAFSVDKRIAKTQALIADVQNKYKTELENIKNQEKLVDDRGKPIGEPVSKKMANVQERLANLNSRLDEFNKEKADNTATPDQMKELKNGFRIIGPDNKVWNLHQQTAPIWNNAMEMKGMWEKQGLLGDAYRTYTQGKAIWVRSKLLASLFHPVHELVIDISSDMASAAEHLIQGGKLSDLKNTLPTFGIENAIKAQDHPAIQAYNKADETRTPEQKAQVQRMMEGGFTPTISARDTVRFRENFDKAINGVGPNNLRLLGTAMEIPGMALAPLFEHWIPGMKTDSYFQRTDLALKRDPTLVQDAGRRGEVYRKIAQDIDRNYGEMNANTQFWNPIVRDVFNAATLSGGWKLAMLQNFRGLAEPAKLAYNFAKTGEFSKADITHQMLQSYIYTANMLLLGAGLNYMLSGTIGSLKDWMNPQTGDKNPDGTPIRLNQPAFFREVIMLLHDMNTDGVVPGAGSFLYHQTLIPGIAQTLDNKDYVGRKIISDPTDLHQWANAGYDFIKPITISNTERANEKGSTTARNMGWLGFPIAGSYINQTPFEQKVTSAYDEQNPAKGDVYSAKLKNDLKSYLANGNTKAAEETEQRMREEGMTAQQIKAVGKTYKQPFINHAWEELSIQDQRRLYKYADDEEKAKFKMKKDK